MRNILRHLRQTALLQARADLSDGQLLDRFVARREEAAFEALVRRHGPMVLGVCLRALGNLHDAEDAFQATFLVLVRKAASVRPRDQVGNWLYGVACRTALRARCLNAKRRARERQAAERPRPEPSAWGAWEELAPLLDEELSRLPDKYRAPVVLCDLQGKTRGEAARRLGWPVGTVSWRLAAARKLLARRLARRGVTLPAGALALALASGSASAGVPGALALSTTKAALVIAAGKAAAAGVVSAQVAAITEGVLKAMFLTKVKIATAVVCGVAAVGLGAGGVMYHVRAASGAPGVGPQSVQATEADGRREDPKTKAPRDNRRDAADQGGDREQALREELEQARRELEKLRAEAEHQRRQAAAERDRAEMEMQEFKAQLRRAQERVKSGRDPGQPPTDDEARLLEQGKVKILRDFERRRKMLLDQLRDLDTERQKATAELDRQFERSRTRAASQPPGAGGPPQTRDKMDLILERLERMEKRLDRLEHGTPKPAS